MSPTGGLQEVKSARPEPNPQHVADAEKKEQERQAINYVMARDNISYPDAKEVVASKGAANLLAEREGTDTKAHEKTTAAQALRQKLTHTPAEVVNFLLELNDRVTALEAGSGASKEPDPAA